MKIRILVTREYIYEPDFEDDFYADCSTMEEALAADKKWVADHKGEYKDLDNGDSEITSAVWQIWDEKSDKVVFEVK